MFPSTSAAGVRIPIDPPHVSTSLGHVLRALGSLQSTTVGNDVCFPVVATCIGSRTQQSMNSTGRRRYRRPGRQAFGSPSRGYTGRRGKTTYTRIILSLRQGQSVEALRISRLAFPEEQSGLADCFRWAVPRLGFMPRRACKERLDSPCVHSVPS